MSMNTVADVLTAEDIQKVGFEVVSEGYHKKEDNIHNVVTHLDLGDFSSALLQYNFFPLDDGMTSAADCLKRYEAMGNPHLCYMVLRNVAKSAKASAAIEHLKTIVTSMETEAVAALSRICDDVVQVNSVSLELTMDFSVNEYQIGEHEFVLERKNFRCDKENFWPIEPYPAKHDANQQPPSPLLVCCTANSLAFNMSDDQSSRPTSDTNPGDSLKSNYSGQYQYPCMEAEEDDGHVSFGIK